MTVALTNRKTSIHVETQPSGDKRKHYNSFCDDIATKYTYRLRILPQQVHVNSHIRQGYTWYILTSHPILINVKGTQKLDEHVNELFSGNRKLTTLNQGKKIERHPGESGSNSRLTKEDLEHHEDKARDSSRGR